MKKMLPTLLVALSMVTSATQACTDEKMHDKLEKIAMKLELSKEQRAQIQAIHQESKQKLMPLRAEMISVHQHVNEAYHNNAMNGFKLNGFVREEKEIVGNAIKVRMDERYKINQLLTEKQRIKFSEMIEHWEKEHFEKMHHQKDHHKKSKHD
jgi:Spy/CpxP family protein refolding chaperone